VFQKSLCEWLKVLDVAKASNNNLQFFFAIALIGSAALTGFYRARQGAQIFSSPLFERSGPTDVITGSVSTSETTPVRAPISQRVNPDAGATEIAFNPMVFAQNLVRTLEADARVSDDAKRRLRAVFATRADIAQNGLAQGNAEARSLILQALDRITRARIGESLLVDANTFLAALETVDSPSARRIRTRFNAAIARDAKISRSLALIEALPLSEERIELASGNLQSVLKLDPNNPRVLRGLETLEQQICASANLLMEKSLYPQALSLLGIGEARVSTGSLIRQTRAEVYLAQANAEARLLEQFGRGLSQQRYQDSETALAQLALFLPDARMNQLRAQLSNAKSYGGFERGQSFRDRALKDTAAILPEMRVIPIGRFVMGTPVNEQGRTSAEGPQREIEITRGFALSVAEISVQEFAQFVQMRDYVSDAERLGSSLIYDSTSGRMARKEGVNWRVDYAGEDANDALPVVHISFQDALAYVNWLTELTGVRYRLPSESEFEYAVRGNQQSRYWWGNAAPTKLVENLTGQEDRSETGRAWSAGFAKYDDGFWGPAPTRFFRKNAFGLFDINGNVSEWVQDCWHDGYARAPLDARAWENPGCAERVVRARAC
jgi:formylglycine-generating enzyme required for sulfatase activity